MINIIKWSKIKRILAFVLGYLIFTCQIEIVKGQELNFKKLNIENGLSQDDVSSIIQDSYGFIWVGTFDGLNRFDGRNVETFHRETGNPASLPDNRIKTLFEDHKKRLWIGTQTGVFSCYSLLHEKFIKVSAPGFSGVITNFHQVNDSTIYALSSSGILKLQDGPNPQFNLIPSSKYLPFRDAVKLPDGKMVVVGNAGIYLFQNEKLIRLNQDKHTFTSILLAGNQIIAGGYDGLYVIDVVGGVQKKLIKGLSEISIESMTKDQNSNIWIGTINDGLIQLDKSLNYVKQIKASKTQPRGLLSNTILDLYYDRNNNLWVGNRQGLCFTNLYNTGFHSITIKDINLPNVRNILIHNDDMYLGISNEGLFRYNLKDGFFNKLVNVNYVNHIEKIDNQLYVCSDKGLLISNKQDKFEQIKIESNGIFSENSSIRCIAKDSYGTSYLGTSNGVFQLKKINGKVTIEPNPILENTQRYHIFRMFFDSLSNQLLLGTRSSGLVILEMNKKGKFAHITEIGLRDFHGKEIPNTSVWSFCQTRDKAIWVGTSAGLFRRSPGAEFFKQVNIKGILDRKIMSIAEDANHNLWLASTYGLIRFSPVTKK